jgi:hypothetical protein
MQAPSGALRPWFERSRYQPTPTGDQLSARLEEPSTRTRRVSSFRHSCSRQTTAQSVNGNLQERWSPMCLARPPPSRRSRKPSSAASRKYSRNCRGGAAEQRKDSPALHLPVLAQLLRPATPSPCDSVMPYRRKHDRVSVQLAGVRQRRRLGPSVRAATGGRPIGLGYLELHGDPRLRRAPGQSRGRGVDR